VRVIRPTPLQTMNLNVTWHETPSLRGMLTMFLTITTSITRSQAPCRGPQRVMNTYVAWENHFLTSLMLKLELKSNWSHLNVFLSITLLEAWSRDRCLTARTNTAPISQTFRICPITETPRQIYLKVQMLKSKPNKQEWQLQRESLLVDQHLVWELTQWCKPS
jgi:hypothetical protein